MRFIEIVGKIYVVASTHISLTYEVRRFLDDCVALEVRTA